ncbi:uncharacterized protein LACBIDRAFT_326699 [Laccaria bicolor S238N-H82]|uniref:Predicted protein n=1 Tax=Laccaria bicolor (strain S238N-H82 / ATCC MYA-4686) TaxID=486041 RepID=B0D9F0_LACBS|nr:uncharacterized protein LACBIDRAFT_326699 [Laccaria bicolor S238N-H82]EDR08343.1 predicted protein [Laccaria bicolor S238N-H82]|eukprot:XP_001880568.1 predicted protein [Laccaria bicolor S238N-H82]
MENHPTKNGTQWTSIAACRNNLFLLEKDPRHPVTALAISLLYEQTPDNFTHGAGCVDCATHDNVTSARKNIHFTHAEVEKTLVDGRNLKWAKERNEYLTPGDPQYFHVLSTAVGKHDDVFNNASTPPQSIPAARARTLYLDHPSLTRAFDPLLLTTGSTMKKYCEELPKILMNGVGMGEMERRCRMKGGGPDMDSPNTSTTFGTIKETQTVFWLVKQVVRYNGQMRLDADIPRRHYRSSVHFVSPQKSYQTDFGPQIRYKAALPDQSANSPATERPVETANHFASYLAFPVTFHGLRLQ